MSGISGKTASGTVPFDIVSVVGILELMSIFTEEVFIVSLVLVVVNLVETGVARLRIFWFTMSSSSPRKDVVQE